MSVDRSRKKGDFWITGSQVFRLMKNVSESLAGRVGIVNLLGLSDAEIYQEPSEPFQTDSEYLMKRLTIRTRKDLNEIYRRIFKGSMPELYADETIDWETYYRSYVDTYLQLDIRDLAQFPDEMKVYNFIYKSDKSFLFDFYCYFFIAIGNYLWSFIAFMLIDICIFAAESEHILI